MTASVEDTASINAWAEFLHSYANGHLPSDQPIPLPPLSTPNILSASSYPLTTDDSQQTLYEHDTNQDGPPSPASSCFTTNRGSSPDNDNASYDFANPVYSSVEISPAVAARVRAFYLKHNFLPPPRAPLEFLREQCIQEHELYSEEQAANVQKATDLVQAFFGGIVTFTLFKHSQQELIAISGTASVIDSIGLFVGKRLLPETSLCGHSILARQNVYIENLAKDWRYCGNPYADELKGVKSYLGSVVSLNVDPASPTEDRVVPVGVINLMHLDDFMRPLSTEQAQVMDHITRMLETSLRSTWEGHRRTREARARRAISNFLEVALIHASTSEPDPNADNLGSPSTSARSDPISSGPVTVKHEDGGDGTNPMETCAQYAAKQIKAVLGEVERVLVIDVQSVVPVKDSNGPRRYVTENEAPTALPLLAFEASSAPPPRGEITPDTVPAVINSLNLFNSRRKVTYDRLSNLSGFEHYLSESSFTHLVIPFFSADQPLFLFIVSSDRPFFSFRASEINFIRSMGVVLRAKLVQSRVIEADAAKTAFLSSISHELRTPMHGVLSGLQLLREAVATGNMDEVEQILKLTESSGTTLQSILNDVLDFGRLEQQGMGQGNKRTEVDLASAIRDVIATCRPKLDEASEVELVEDIEERNWRVQIDSVGFQRILLNGLTNALKFTKEGRITVSLRTMVDHRISLKVRDTGRGLDPTFASRVFEPFTKADDFTPGAGLGLHISRTLAERMGGTVTLASLPVKGAIFEAKLPVEFVPSDTSKVNGTEGLLSSLSITPRAKASPALSRPKLRILIADDNEIALEILSTLLRRISKKIPLEISRAKDGQEATDQFVTFHPHLVLTDVSMPRKDGIQAAVEMRQMESKVSNGLNGAGRTKIYAITGLGSSDPRLKTESMRGSAALDGWLIKGQDRLSTIRNIVEDVSSGLAALEQ